MSGREYCHLCGHKYAQTNTDPITCKNCSNVSYANPSPTAMAILFNADRRVLVAQRAQNPFKGKYSVAGGFIDIHETVEEALAREISEEFGLTPDDYTAPKYVSSLSKDYPFSNETKIVLPLFFTAQLITDKTPKASDDVENGRFIALDELDSLDYAREELPEIIREAYKILFG